MKEKVDILIVCHNYSRFLNDCLYSIFSSTKLSIKVLIIVNNPQDKKSLNIIKKYQVKILINKKEKGLASNLNQGIKMIKVKYILVLNPDTKLTKKL